MKCRAPDCNRKVRANELCIRHNQEWLAGLPFSELPPKRSRREDRSCSFPGCGRPLYANGWCRPHDKQARTGRPLHPVGDLTASNAAKRAAWDRLTADQRAQRLQSSIHRPDAEPYVRTEEWRRRMSQSRAGISPNIPGERSCFGCGTAFTARSGPQTWCSIECRNRHRKANHYGITLGELTSIEARQNHVCAICGQTKPLHIDHDHTTGRVRGLLCSTCNTGLGKLGDNVDTLRRAIAYLER